MLISSQTTQWVGVFTNNRTSRVLLSSGMTKKISQVLEEWLWGPLGEMGLHVSMNMKLSKLQNLESWTQTV